MIGALHHMPDPRAALKHFIDILKPGGWLLANEPQSTNPLIQFTRRIRSLVDSSYSDEQDQYAPRALAQLVRDAGFVEIETVGQGLFSTPFAEVPLPGQRLLAPLVEVLVATDTLVERLMPAFTARAAWNTVLRARKPRPN